MATTFPPSVLAPLPPDDDLDGLRRIVRFIERFLGWLLRQEHLFPYREDLEILGREFEESVLPLFRRIQDQLREPTDAQRSALERAGLTSSSLRMKWTLLLSDVIRGRIKRIIARINSILGSLSSVFPAAETIKEFKDQTEASIGDLQDEEGPQPLEI